MRKNRIAMAVGLAFPLAFPMAFSAHAQTSSVLPPVTVTGQVDRYVVPLLTSALRDAVPLEQIPQSVIGVTRRLIEDQGAQTVEEALRNVSNVRVMDRRDLYNTQSRIRGFNAAQVVDGQAMPSMFSNLETTANVERIEVIKGPAPAVGAGGQAAGAQGVIGGAIAITTKVADFQTRREIGLRLGTRAERGLHFDVNQPLSETLAVRLVGEIQHNGSESDRVFFRRTSLFPSATLKTGAGELQVRLRSSRLATLDYSGLPPEGTVLPAAWTLPRSLNTTAAGQPDSTSAVDGFNVQWKQRLGAQWSLDLNLGYTNAKLDQNGVFTDDFFAPNPGPNYFLSGLNLTQKVKSTSISPTLKGQFQLGGLTHRLVAGLDWDRTTDFGYMANSGGLPGALGLYNITTPTRPAWQPLVVNLAGAQDNRYTSRALFAQDRVSFGQGTHLLLALRHVSISVDNAWPDFGVNNKTSNSKTSPRIGLVHELSPAVSVFAGVGEGMSIPTNGIYASPPKPEGTRQTEVGLRLKDFHGWNLTAAWFDLARTNVPVSNPANPFQSIQTGEQRSSGIDLDATYRVDRNLTLMGHLTHQNPRITQDTTLKVGSQLFNVPKRSARLAARYDLTAGALAGLGMGLGVSHRSALPGNAANAYFTPAATVWDAQLSYEQGPARYAVAINNLLDRKYYEPAAYFSGGHVTPATRRQVTFNANYKF